MFSYVLSSAKSYFYLPIDEEEEEDTLLLSPKHIPWPSGSPSSSFTYGSRPNIPESDRMAARQQILSNDDLYQILGISRSASLDRISLRRAYLTRSKACHPDKFPDDPEATRAFQKVSMAYDVLSKPSSKRMYDSRPQSSPYDYFSGCPPNHAEETFKSVIIGVFNDFLDGDLEVIRTLLRAINDMNPSLKLGDDGINSVLGTLQNIRDRALTCRSFIYALHAELTHLLEVQHAFRQLSYFDLMGRSRLIIKLTRITLSLPVVLERAIQQQNHSRHGRRGCSTPQQNDFDRTIFLPRRLNMLLKGVDAALERMERIVK